MLSAKFEDGKRRLERYLSSEVVPYALLKEILLPIFWEQLFLACLAIVSIWLLSFDGTHAMSAVNMMALVTKTFTSVCLGLATGATVLVAQSVGAKKFRQAQRCMAQALALSVGVTAAMCAALVFLREPLLRYLLNGVEPAVYQGSLTYFTGVLAAFPFYAFYTCFAGAMRGWGRSALAWRLTFAVNLAELALTCILLIGFKLGVLGVTLAVAASWTLGACVAAHIIMKERRAISLENVSASASTPSLLFSKLHAIIINFMPSKTIIKALLIIALPLALEQLFFNGGRAVSQRYIAPYGTSHMAANGIVNALFDIFNLPQITLREALVTVVGMSVGCGRYDLARRYVYRFLRVIRGFLLAFTPFAALLSTAVTALFNLGNEVNSLVFYCLAAVYIAGPFLLGGGLSIPAGLRAGGDAPFVSIATLVCMWGVRVCFSWFFAAFMGLGVLGINLAMILDWIARSIIFRSRLKTSVWYARLLVRS